MKRYCVTVFFSFCMLTVFVAGLGIFSLASYAASSNPADSLRYE
ncbi:MAG: hypothetical protein ACQERH_04240 [Acidobacteriota bacterium]